MSNRLLKSIIIAIIIALPAAYICTALVHANLSEIAVSEAFASLASQTGFTSAYVSVLVCFVVAMMVLNTATSTISSPSEPGTFSSDRETGIVKWFNVSKGFGFISRESGDDVFVHYRSIRGEGHRKLMEGQRVEFTVTEGDKGLQAEDVIPAPK